MSHETFRAFAGYGKKDDTTDRDKRKHLSMCDGVYCERDFCDKGNAWRLAHSYKVEIDKA